MILEIGGSKKQEFWEKFLYKKDLYSLNMLNNREK
jgi:hypothetical protein